MSELRFHTPSTYARNRIVHLLGKAAGQVPTPRGQNYGLAETLHATATRVQRSDGDALSQELRELWAVFAPTGDFETAGGREATGTALFALLTALQIRR